MTSPRLTAAANSTRTEAEVRAERTKRAIFTLQESPGDERDPDQRGPCSGHEFAYTGSAYGGDDDSYHGEGRAYCIHCGADGDA